MGLLVGLEAARPSYLGIWRPEPPSVQQVHIFCLLSPASLAKEELDQQPMLATLPIGHSACEHCLDGFLRGPKLESFIVLLTNSIYSTVI